MLPVQEEQKKAAIGSLQEELNGLSTESLAALIQTDQPLTKVVRENEREVMLQVDATVLYAAHPGEEPREHTIICLDPGKFSNKAGGIQQKETSSQGENAFLRKAKPKFVTVNEPVTYKTATQATYSGDLGLEMYRLHRTSAKTALIKATTGGDRPEQGSWFRFGHEALTGDSLPVSDEFHQRWSQWRYRAIWYATIAKSAQAIGLQPSLLSENMDIQALPSHPIILCIALPDEELIDTNGEQHLNEKTKEALNDSKDEFVIEQQDAAGTNWIWKFQVTRIDIIAQSLAAWFAIFKDIQGNEAPINVKKSLSDKGTAITGNVFIDTWGGGDRQRAQFVVRNGGKPIMYAHKLAEGTHILAQQLIPLVYKKHRIRINLAQAQVALYLGYIEFEGNRLDVQDLVNELHSTGFEKLITTAAITNEIRTSYWIHAGAGAVLLSDSIQEYLKINNFLPHQYMVMPSKAAPLLSVVGGWARTYFLVKEAMRKSALEQQQQQEVKVALTRRMTLALNHLSPTDRKYQQKQEALHTLKDRVEQVPAWSGHLRDLTEIEHEFTTVVPQEPWNEV